MSRRRGTARLIARPVGGGPGWIVGEAPGPPPTPGVLGEYLLGLGLLPVPPGCGGTYERRGSAAALTVEDGSLRAPDPAWRRERRR